MHISGGDAVVIATSAVVGAAIAVASAIAYTRFAFVQPLLEEDLGEDGESPSKPKWPSFEESSTRTGTPRKSWKQLLQRARLQGLERSQPRVRPRGSNAEVADVTRIVLTGGPCGGKSSCLNQLVHRLQEHGYEVFVAPEMPTLLKYQCGCAFPFVPSPTPHDEAHQLKWEACKMQLQMDMEDALTEVATSSGKRSVVICDRGMPDSAAYVSEEAFAMILDDRDWLLDKLMAR